MGSVTTPDPQNLLAQLQALVDKPEAFSAHQKEIVRLCQKGSILFENAFDTYRRVGYSVSE